MYIYMCKQYVIMANSWLDLGLKHQHYAPSDSIAKTLFRNSCWKERYMTLSIKHGRVIKGGT